MRLPEEINVNELVSITKNTFTTTGTIDDPSNLANARVWLLRYWGESCLQAFSSSEQYADCSFQSYFRLYFFL